MFYRKLILLLAVHFVSAYCFGNEIYGFSGEPNKAIALASLGILAVLTFFAKEQDVNGLKDSLLAMTQGMLAAVSGAIGSADSVLGLAVPVLILGTAIAVCYVRTARGTAA